MSRAFSSLAMSPKDLAPAALMSSITGVRSAARASADADRACRALAQTGSRARTATEAPEPFSSSLSRRKGRACAIRNQLRFMFGNGRLRSPAPLP
jgi:hypothetical protein